MTAVDFTQKKIFKFLFYTYCFGLLWELFYWFLLSLDRNNFLTSFSSFTMSDWLINYEAGFVRRGLWGQVFYYLYVFGGANVGYLVYFLSYLFLFGFLYIFIREWKRNNLSLFLLPSVCLIGAFSMSYLLGFRRDVLIFLLIWFILRSYHSFLLGNKKALWGMYLLSGVAILSHEASFFYFAPLLGVHFFLFQKDKKSLRMVFGRSILFLLPIVFVMLLCVVYKGDERMANEIWHSWDNYFISNFGETLPIGKGCEALGWNGMDTFKMHFNVNFLYKTLGVYRFCLWPFIFMAVYYLLIQVNKVKIGVLERGEDNASLEIQLSQILILQFIFLLPMFTVLSCDFRRVILYWTLSSFLFYFGLGQNFLQAFRLKWFTKRVLGVNKVLSTGFLGNKYFYMFVFIFLGIPFAGFSETDAFLSSVFGNIAFVLKYTIYFIYGA